MTSFDNTNHTIIENNEQNKIQASFHSLSIGSNTSISNNGNQNMPNDNNTCIEDVNMEENIEEQSENSENISPLHNQNLTTHKELKITNIPYKSTIRWNSGVLSRYPWSTDVIMIRGNLSESFKKDHWLQNLFVSLASTENALQFNDTGDWNVLAQLLLNNNLPNHDISNTAIKTREILHLQSRSKKSWALCGLISAYRLVDIVAMVEDIPNRIPVPHHNRQYKLFDSSNKLYDRLSDWPALITRFLSSAQSLKSNTPTISLKENSNLHSIFLHTLYRLRSTSSISKIMFNLQLAALHISVMTKNDFETEIPDLPSDLGSMIASIMPQQDLTATKKEFFESMAAYSPQQLRLPLQIALLISPLILLSSSELHKAGWDRRKLILTAKAIGNYKPEEILNIERELWLGIFRLARGEIDVYSLVQELQEKFSSLNMTSLTSVNDWFQSEIHGTGKHKSFDIDDRTLMSIDIKGAIDTAWPTPVAIHDLQTEEAVEMSNVVTPSNKGKRRQSSVSSNDTDGDNEEQTNLTNLDHAFASNTAMDIDTTNNDKQISIRESQRLKNKPASQPLNPSTVGNNKSTTKKRKKHVHLRVLTSAVQKKLNTMINTDLDPRVIISEWRIIDDLESGKKILTLKSLLNNTRFDVYTTNEGKTINRFKAWSVSHSYEVSPSLHHESDLSNLYQFVDAVQKYFDKESHQPLHKTHPDRSIWKLMTQDEFDDLTTENAMEILETRHICIYDIENPIVKFDRQGLRNLKSLDAIVKVEDQSASYDSKNRFEDGSLQQVLEAASKDGGKILLVDHIPLTRAPVEISTYSSDVYAWNETEGERYCKESEHVPTADIRWGRASLMGAFTGWRIIPEGFGSVIEIKTGNEWLIVARPTSVDQDTYVPITDYFAKITLFLDDFHPQHPNSHRWHLEAIYLEARSRIILRPNTLYAMYTAENSICHGNYFYAISTIQDTFYGIVHRFTNHQIPSNDISSSRYLLQRMLVHCYKVYSNNDIKVAEERHVPQLDDITSMLNLLTLCFLVILSNVLDPRTYLINEGDDTEQKMDYFDYNQLSALDRRRCTFFRGMAWHILTWIQENFDFTDASDGTKYHFFTDIVYRMFQCQSQAILNYKAKALERGIQGAQGCTYERLQTQINSCFEDHFTQRDMDDDEFENVENLQYAGLENISIKLKKINSPLKHLNNEDARKMGTTSKDVCFSKGRLCGFALEEDTISDDSPTGKRMKTQ